MPAITAVKLGDQLSPADPPVCCRQSMVHTRGVAGPLFECVVCEAGIYTTTDGRVTAVMANT